jgi:hypothetical protein
MSSDYLFATPSFLRGFARVVDFWGTPEPYNWSPTPDEADAANLYVDWVAVAGDLNEAMQRFSVKMQPVNAQMSLFDGKAEPRKEGAERSRETAE